MTRTNVTSSRHLYTARKQAKRRMLENLLAGKKYTKQLTLNSFWHWHKTEIKEGSKPNRYK